MSVLEVNHPIAWSSFERNINPASPLTADVSAQFLKNKIGAVLQSRWRSELPSHRDHIAVDHIFNQLLDNQQISYSALKSIETAKAIFDRIDSDISTIGPANRGYSLDLEAGVTHKADASNVLKLLIGASFKRHVLSWKMIKAILLKKDPEVIKELTAAIELMMKEVHQRLISPDLTPDEEKMNEIFLGNLLALYTFAEPTEKHVEIPQKIDNKWVLVNYGIEILHLTPEWAGIPIPAYGCKPISHFGAHPLLIFRGTPHPTADGVFNAIASDLVPGYAVGEFIYEHCAKDKIKNWVNEANRQYGTVNLYGQSLGGSLSLLTMCNQPDKVHKVFTYGSPAPLGNSLKAYSENIKGKGGYKPEVNLFWNHGDLVPLVGTGFHEDWNLFKLIIPRKQYRFESHATINAGMEKAVLVKMSHAIVNNALARKLMNIFHQAISVLLLPIFVSVLALRYMKFSVVRGCKRLHNYF